MVATIVCFFFSGTITKSHRTPSSSRNITMLMVLWHQWQDVMILFLLSLVPLLPSHNSIQHRVRGVEQIQFTNGRILRRTTTNVNESSSLSWKLRKNLFKAHLNWIFRLHQQQHQPHHNYKAGDQMRPNRMLLRLLGVYATRPLWALLCLW